MKYAYNQTKHIELLKRSQDFKNQGRSFDKELIHLVELLLCDFLDLSLLNFEVSFHRGLRDLLRTETLRIAEGASLSNVG